jgi:bifunctional DNA-binding transcriptional regulator/antitoxin component of YhaV-PrlF toxin-antitoxin module
MTLTDIRSATITEKGQIAIPRQMRNLKGFGTGSKIAIMCYADHLELRPLKQVSESLLTAIASEKTLAKDWDTKEEEKAWGYLKERAKKK